jgi:hypothetical protein
MQFLAEQHLAEKPIAIPCITSFVTARLVHRILHSGSADTSDGRNPVDRPIAHTMTLYLKRDDAQDSSLAFSVVVPQIVR